MQGKRILMVLTNHNRLGNSGKQTGFYLPEVAHPHDVWTRAGFTVDYVSPKGGKAPITGIDLQDPLSQAFLNDPNKVAQVENTLNPGQIDPAKYDAIFYAGGHGAMWDFPNNQQLAQIAAGIYEQGGTVSAVCHGVAGLLNIQLSNNEYLVAGKSVSCFTNEEEEAVELSQVVPFLLESKLIERNAKFTKAPNFQPHTVVSERLVTGQNPASATDVAKLVVNLLQSRHRPSTILSPSSL